MSKVYRKSFNQEGRRNILNKLKIYLIGIKKIVVNNVLGESKTLKYYLSLILNFHKANEPSILTNPPAVFLTEVFTSVNVEYIDGMFTGAADLGKNDQNSFNVSNQSVLMTNTFFIIFFRSLQKIRKIFQCF